MFSPPDVQSFAAMKKKKFDKLFDQIAKAKLDVARKRRKKYPRNTEKMERARSRASRVIMCGIVERWTSIYLPKPSTPSAKRLLGGTIRVCVLRTEISLKPDPELAR